MNYAAETLFHSYTRCKELNIQRRIALSKARYAWMVQNHNIQRWCIPIVDINVVVKWLSENLNNMQVFPTPESPMRSSLNSKS